MERQNNSLRFAIVIAMLTAACALSLILLDLSPLSIAPTVTPTTSSLPTSITKSPTYTPEPTFTAIALSSTVDVEGLYAQVSQLRIDVDQLKSNNTNSQLENKVDSLGTRLGTIEEVILENPAKALQSASLKNEVDNINSELESTKGELDRMSNLYLGILGLIFALAASNIFSSLSLRKQKSDSGEAILSELKEQIKELNTQIEKLSHQNTKPE